MVIYFPGLRLDCLYPFAAAHPLNYGSRSQWVPGGPFDEQLGDAQLNRLMAENPGTSPDVIYDHYKHLDYADLVDLDQLRRQDLERLELLGGLSGLDIVSPIASMMRLWPVLWTNLHPTMTLGRLCYMHLLAQLPLRFSRSRIFAVIAQMADSSDYNHAPIHPSIIRHFDLAWASDDFRYQFGMEGAFTHQELSLRYISLRFEERLSQARLEVMQDTAVAEAVDVLEQYISRCPASAQTYHVLSINLWKLNRRKEALAAGVRAHELSPCDPRLNDFLAFLARGATFGT